MADYIELNKKQYGIDGLVPLKRGDDWMLLGKIVERYSSYKGDKDLTDVVSATAYFEGATGGTIASLVSIDNASCGVISIAVDADDTDDIEESPFGTSFYVVLERAGSQYQTIQTYDFPLNIQDRGFPTS